MNKVRMISIILILAMTFSFASVSPVAASALPKVAVYHADSYANDVVIKLTATGLFSQVDNLSPAGCGANPTPTLATLQQYAAVMVWSNCGFNNATALGNVLADYVDAGGHVVVSTFALWTENVIGIGGRFDSGGYLPVTQGSQSAGTRLFLVADLPSDPLLAGVNSLDGGSASYHNTPLSLVPGAILVAHWTNGQPLVAYKGNVVALNFFPPSSDIRGDFWNSATDGVRLMTNALTFNLVTDTTLPTASPTQAPPANGAGWNNSDVTVSWNWSDEVGGSGIDTANCTTSSLSSGEGNITLNATCKDLAGNMGNASYSVMIDKTAPAASASALPSANGNGWNNTDVTVTFSGDDGTGSGIDSCTSPVVLSSEGTGQSASGTCTDKAGNLSAPTAASGINIDKTLPTVSLVDGPADGGSYYFGSVPAAPTCSASDAFSGLDGSCTVSGYSALVGPQTVTATAEDVAENQNSASASYTVLAWTINGFFQPVDMGGVWNTVKGGSTVPLKFKVFAGSTELTDTSIVNQPLKATQALCSGGTTNEVELVATGATSLRYDTTDGQFIYNWKTPKKPGYCYVVTITMADGSTISANFKLK